MPAAPLLRLNLTQVLPTYSQATIARGSVRASVRPPMQTCVVRVEDKELDIASASIEVDAEDRICQDAAADLRHVPE